MDSVPHADWQAQGVTGADPSLPTFDGSSTKPDDHLIQLDDDSMETAPDVRVYFWLVGLCHRGNPREPPPPTLEERELWDDVIVREGREYLRQARAEGKGFFLDRDRASDIVAGNQPGSYWYRMSAASIIQDFKTGALIARKSEGYFWKESMEPMSTLIGCDPTNIRINIWWANCMNSGVGPGTIGYDCPIRIAYNEAHPGVAVWENRSRASVLNRLRYASAGGDHWADPDKTEEMLSTLWPPTEDEKQQKRPTREDYDKASAKQPDLLARQGLTARDFLCEPPDEEGGEEEQEG